MQPVIILVEPQMGENIGAAARAMLNFGLDQLRLVNPRDGWPNEKAIEMSAGADQVTNNVQVFATLREAIADLNFIYASTARPRHMVKPVVTPRKAAEEIANDGHKVGILFGPERSGLNNEDVSLADKIITIPVNEAFSSLNIAQSVVVIAYELRQLENEPLPEKLDLGVTSPASKEEVVGFFQHLEDELDAVNFFKTPEKKPAMNRNIRNIFNRAGLTDQDVRTLRGVIRSLTARKD